MTIIPPDVELHITPYQGKAVALGEVEGLPQGGQLLLIQRPEEEEQEIQPVQKPTPPLSSLGEHVYALNVKGRIEKSIILYYYIDI